MATEKSFDSLEPPRGCGGTGQKESQKPMLVRDYQPFSLMHAASTHKSS